MISAAEAMERAIDKGDTGRLDEARFWLDVARELRVGTRRLSVTAGPPGVTSGEIAAAARRVFGLSESDYGRTHGGEPAFNPGGIIETTADTPIYEAAGDQLGDTEIIPTQIAHPEPESRGGYARCLNCPYSLRWVRSSGWVHDESGDARCPAPVVEP
jgi:hypothetical protein